MNGDPVLIIGGSRATGLHAAHMLRARGVPVRVLARDPAAAASRVGASIEIVRGDITQPGTLHPALRGVGDLIFTAGVRSLHFAREAIVKATEFEGVVNTIRAAQDQGFRGRFVYMTAIGARRRSFLAFALNVWKGNTLVWRRHAEDALRSSGLDYTIVRAAVLLNRPAHQHAIAVTQDESPLTFREHIGRADVAEAMVESLHHPTTSRATFEIKWTRGPRTFSWSQLYSSLHPDDNTSEGP